MKSTFTSRRSKNQKGATFVETSLVLLTMLGMVIFIMDMGRILLMQQYITERARTTVRSAVVNDWTSTAAANYLVYNSTTAPNGGGAGFIGLQTSQVSYQKLGIAGAPDYRVQIKVTNVPALVLTPYMAGTYTLAPIVATMPAQSLGSTN
ncbi:MAG: TadE family protein [Bryobacterales bacterium]|nr:TadE family protein [Bryobacterales bacterium]